MNAETGLHTGVWVYLGVWIPNRCYVQAFESATAATYRCLYSQPRLHMGVWIPNRGYTQVFGVPNRRLCKLPRQTVTSGSGILRNFFGSRNRSETFRNDSGMVLERFSDQVVNSGSDSDQFLMTWAQSLCQARTWALETGPGASWGASLVILFLFRPEEKIQSFFLGEGSGVLLSLKKFHRKFSSGLKKYE